MTDPTPLRLRAGGSIVLPKNATDADIDNAGRAAAENDESILQVTTGPAAPATEEQS